MLTGHKKDKILPQNRCESDLAEELSTFYKEKIENIRNNILISNNLGSTSTMSSHNQFNNENGFSKFNLISEEDLTSILSTVKKKSCRLDPIPCDLLTKALDFIKPIIIEIINKSIAESNFPTPLKHAHVTPALKDPKLDPNVLNHLRPISRLPYLSKIIEKFMYNQLNTYIESNKLHSTVQSSYRRNHSCETAILKITDDMQKSIQQGHNVVMVLLDSSAAFDTIDHKILIQRLQDEYNITGDALQLIKSYLSDRTFSTIINQTTSSKRQLRYGVPQGSLLGPLLYILYTKNIEIIIKNHQLNCQMYADDCQLYSSFTNSTLSETEIKIKTCLKEIENWMNKNFLKLNPNKTVIKVFSAKPTIYNDFKIFTPSDSNYITLLGVNINNNLGLQSFISKKVRTCLFHLRNFYNIRKNLDRPTRIRLVISQIISTLDYCNIVLIASTEKDLKPLRLTMNRAVRFIFGLRLREHITPFYKKLHLLPIKERVKFKACSTAHKVFYGSAPNYLIEQFNKFIPSTQINLRTTTGRDDFMFSCDLNTVKSKNLMSIIKVKWNSLPCELRKCASFPLFKSKLKTLIYNDCFSKIPDV